MSDILRALRRHESLPNIIRKRPELETRVICGKSFRTITPLSFVLSFAVQTRAISRYFGPLSYARRVGGKFAQTADKNQS